MSSGFNESDVGRAVIELVESLMADIHTCMPGKVEAYDYASQKATVTPLLRRAFLDGSQVAHEPIPGVPVIFPSSSVASMTFPIKAGDTILLVFSEKSLERWLPAGGTADTTVNRHHSLGDAIAIPGLFPLNHSSDAPNNDDLQVKLGTQKITIKENGDIEIGNANLKALLTADYMTHTHVFTGTAVVDPGTHIGTCAGTTNASTDVTSKTTKVTAQ
jgi:hypothetical protein